MASMHFAGDSDRAVWVLIFYLFVYLLASFSVFEDGLGSIER